MPQSVWNKIVHYSKHYFMHTSWQSQQRNFNFCAHLFSDTSCQHSILSNSWKVKNLKFRVFWDVTPCSLGVDWLFRGAYCLHHHPDDGGSTHLWSFGPLQDCMALHPRDSKLHTRHHENLKSQKLWTYTSIKLSSVKIFSLYFIYLY
jgi:hypothetical protein